MLRLAIVWKGRGMGLLIKSHRQLRTMLRRLLRFASLWKSIHISNGEQIRLRVQHLRRVNLEGILLGGACVRLATLIIE